MEEVSKDGSTTSLGPTSNNHSPLVEDNELLKVLSDDLIGTLSSIIENAMTCVPLDAEFNVWDHFNSGGSSSSSSTPMSSLSSFIYEFSSNNNGPSLEEAQRTILVSLVYLSKSFGDSIVANLLKWRRKELSLVPLIMETNESAKKKAAEHAHEERRRQLIEYIFCKIVLEILRNLNELKLQLSNSITMSIESIAFDYYKENANTITAEQPKHSSKKAIEEVLSEIIGEISHWHLSSLASRFHKELLNGVKLPAYRNALIEAMRFLKINTSTIQDLKEAVTFLNLIYDNWDIFIGKSQQKQVFCETFANILRGLVDKTINFDLNSLENVLTKIYKKLQERHKKKEAYVLYLSSIVLCICEKKFFGENFWQLFPICQDIASKESLVLEGIYALILGYLGKYEQESEVDKVTPVVTYLLKQKVFESERLDVIIDIINLISTTKLKFSIEKFVLPLLETEQSDEKIMIAYLSWMKIANRLSLNVIEDDSYEFGARKSKTKRSPSGAKLSKNFRKSTISNRSRGSLMLNSEETDKLRKSADDFGLMVEHYAKIVIMKTIEILAIFDKKHGNSLKYNNQKKDSGIKLELVKTIFHVIRKSLHIPLFPTSDTQMFELIAKYYLHNDEGIAREADLLLDAVVQVDTTASMRADIINAFANNILLIPDTYPNLLNGCILKLTSMINKAKAVTAEGKYHTICNTTLVDAIAYMSLAHKAPLRTSAINLLEVVQLLSPPISIHHIIETEVMPVKISEIHQYDLEGRLLLEELEYKHHPDYMSMKEHEGLILQITKSKVMPLIEEADSGRWTRVLGIILKVLRRIIPKHYFQNLWHNVCVKLEKLLEFVPGKNSPDFGDLLRNYIVIATGCATSRLVLPVNEQNDPIQENNKGILVDNCYLTTVFFDRIFVPILKSEGHRSSAEIALEFVDSSVTETLLMSIEEYERTTYEQKGKKKALVFRQILSNVYLNVVLSFNFGSLGHNDTVLTKLVLFIQKETLNSLEHVDNDPPGSVNSFMVSRDFQFNLTLICRYMFMQLNTILFKEDLLGPKFRSQILGFLLSLCNTPLGTTPDDSERNLQRASVIAMAHLIDNPYFHQSCKVDEKEVILNLINRTFAESEVFHEATHRLLYNFLKFDKAHVQECITECYNANEKISKGYFLCVTDVFQDQEISLLPTAVLMHLVIYKLGDSDFVTRTKAAKLLMTICEQKYADSNINLRVPQSLCSEEYLNQQLLISFKIAAFVPELTLAIVCEWIARFKSPYLDKHDLSVRNNMLNYIGGWVNNLNFASLQKQEDGLVVALYIIESMLVITERFSNQLPASVHNLWLLVGRKDTNIDLLIMYLFNDGMKRRNKHFISLSKKVILLLFRVAPMKTVTILQGCLLDVPYLKNAPKEFKSSKSRPENLESSWSLDSLFPLHVTAPQLTPSQYSLVMLADLILERDFDLITHLHKLLHVATIYLDSTFEIVHFHAYQLLSNIEFLLFSKSIIDVDLVIERNQTFWKEDVSHESIRSIIHDLINHMAEDKRVGLVEKWILQAIQLISYQDLLLSLRSLHVFDILYNLHPLLNKDVPFTIQNSISLILNGANNSKLTLKALGSLSIIFEFTPVEQLLTYPLIVWMPYLVMRIGSPPEYVEAGRAMSVCLKRFPVSYVAQHIQENVIPDLSIEKLLVTILKGFTTKHSSCNGTSLTLLRQILLCIEEATSEEVVMLLILGLLPWLISESDTAKDNLESAGIVTHEIARICQFQSDRVGAYAKLARLFDTFSHAVLPSVVLSWTQDVAEIFYELYFEQHGHFVLSFISLGLEHANTKYKRGLLQLLLSLCPRIETLSNTYSIVYKLFVLLKELLNSPMEKQALQIMEILISKTSSSAPAKRNKSFDNLGQLSDPSAWWAEKDRTTSVQNILKSLDSSKPNTN